MSISYWINLENPNICHEVAELLISAHRFKFDGDEVTGIEAASKFRLRSPTFIATVTKSSPDWSMMLREELGVNISSNIILFPGNDFATNGIGGRRLTEIVGAILQRFSGDVVFLFNGEQVLLQRDSLGVFVNSGAGFWNLGNRELLATFVPFIEKKLPSV